MARIKLENNTRSSVANRIIDIILAMDNVFRVRDYDKSGSRNITRKAIRDAENGHVVTSTTRRAATCSPSTSAAAATTVLRKTDG